MSAMSKRKGNRAELALAAIYRAAGWRASRVPLSGAGEQRGDVAVPDSGLHIEAKCREALNIWAALTQAETDAPTGRIPVVNFKRNHTRWYAALSLDDFLLLLALARDGAGGDLRSAVARDRAARPDLVEEWRDFIREQAA